VRGGRKKQQGLKKLDEPGLFPTPTPTPTRRRPIGMPNIATAMNSPLFTPAPSTASCIFHRLFIFFRV